ncbi:MAG: motility protein A, partial [Proteobacteria bacterium]|nr:motility protein A [Pseudomonadota bacterium]MBU1611000.1 motility protein A [Pseudomonadota bacterium]
MDLGTVIGIVLSMGLVVSAILTGSSLIIFISVPSALIVLGGTLGAAMVNYPMSYIIGLVGVFKNTFFSSLTPASEIIV